MSNEGLRAEIKRLEGLPCKCLSCPECGGTGIVWFALGGREYLGNSRCDDLDEMESCESCEGLGITEACERCIEIEELEQQLQEIEESEVRKR